MTRNHCQAHTCIRKFKLNGGVHIVIYSLNMNEWIFEWKINKLLINWFKKWKNSILFLFVLSFIIYLVRNYHSPRHHSCLLFYSILFYLFVSKNAENIKYRSRRDDKFVGKVVIFSNCFSVFASRMLIWFSEIFNAFWYCCHVCNIRQASST